MGPIACWMVKCFCRSSGLVVTQLAGSVHACFSKNSGYVYVCTLTVLVFVINSAHFVKGGMGWGGGYG